MEHEDNNTQFANNYLRGNIDEFSLQQNQQNLVENRQIAASGFGAGGIVGVADEIGVSIGGKFVEEEHDEEEWKYIQEVQQSEKQQVLEGERGEGVGNMDGVGGIFVDYDVGRGDGQMLLPAEVDDEEEAAIIKNDGDFSTTSNTTSTTVGEEENSTAAEEESYEMQQQQPLQAIGEAEAPPMLQVEMEIEATKLLAQKNNLAAAVEESSLATGENCENSQQQQQQLREAYKQQQYFDEESEEISGCMFSSSSPLAESNEDEKYEEIAKSAVEEAAVIDFLDSEDAALTRHKKESTRPSELDFEMHSNLNPEAKEFVPIHSNPTSPISPNKSHDILVFASFVPVQSDASPVVLGVDDNKENEDLSVNDSDDDFTADVGDFADKLTLSSAAISPHPNAVPRHMIISDATDDVVAQSPRKGRGSDMDAISLPPENEFEHEAAKRPHEIEQEDDLISNSDAKASDGAEVIMNGMEIGNDEKTNRKAGDSDIHADTGAEHEIQMQETTEDYSDFQNRLDHGPETSVDLDMDSQDVMRQSFYIENTVDMQQQQLQPQTEPAHEQPIEEILNTVQPIPTDSESLNTSFVEGLLDVANKELLYVEEKEEVSNSPSTEELHMRFRNECNAFSNEPTKPSIDMDNVGHMQDSFYMQHTRAPFDTETLTELSQATSAGEVILGTEPSHATDVVSPQEDSPLVDTSHPLGINENFTKNYTFLAEAAAATAPEEMQQFTHFTNEKVANDLIAPSSPQSTEEKHLMEETKENIYVDNEIANLEYMMNDLLLTHEGSLRKVDEVAKSATPINEDQIELITRESQCESKADGSPAFEAEEKREQQLPQDDLFSDEVIFDKVDEQKQQIMMVGEIEHAEQSLLQEPFVSQEMTTEDVVAIAQSPIPGGDTYAPMTKPDFGAETTVPEIEEPFAEHRPEVEAPISSAENPFLESHASVDKTTVTEDEATASTFVSKPISFVDVPVSVPEIPVPVTEVPVSVTEVSDPIPQTEISVAADDAPILPTEAALSEVKNIEVSEAEAEIVSTENITTTAIAATAAVATAATVAAVAVSSLKKSEPAKKARTPSSAASKSKVGGDAKKPTENKKLSTVAAKSTTTSGTARPRTAPSAGANKTSATSEKKTSASLTTTTSAARPASVSAAGRKPMASNTTSAKHPAIGAATGAAKTTISSSNSKSTSTATARNGVAAKATAPRPATAAATRKPTTSTLAASTHVPAAAAPKPRLYTGGAPVKPTTLGISAKPKPTLSPRVRTTTSQMSRTGAGPASAAAKSPLKTAANANTNGIGKTSSSINNASSTNRTKTTSAGITKTFTARPAPKTIFTSTTATTNNSARRATTGSSTKTTSSSVLRKSSPSKSTTGGKISPTKTSVAPISKIKTKDVTTLKSAAKSTTATTTITPTKAAAAANVLNEKQLIEEAVELVESTSPQFNGEPLEHTENGDANHTRGEDANGLIEQGEMALMDGSVA